MIRTLDNPSIPGPSLYSHHIPSITLVSMVISYHQSNRPPFVVCPLSGWCSISINTHWACWQRCGRRMWAYMARHPQKCICSSTVNRAYPLFPLVTQSCMVSSCLKFNLFPLCWWAEGLGNWRVGGQLAESKQVWPGSEEVCGRWGLRGSGLSMGLQKVNYVLVGASLCHRLCCLTILWKNRKKMSYFPIKEIAVGVLILTVAVLCCSFSSKWVFTVCLHLPWHRQYYYGVSNITGRPGFSF